MSSVVKQEEFVEPERTESDEFGFDRDFLFKVTSPEGTDEVYSPDEVSDLISDLVAEQFWDWWGDPARSRRFKPRVKVYEVLQ